MLSQCRQYLVMKCFAHVRGGLLDYDYNYDMKAEMAAFEGIATKSFQHYVIWKAFIIFLLITLLLQF
ncbi:40S ribosomal protein [Dirofilaria immitis]